MTGEKYFSVHQRGTGLEKAQVPPIISGRTESLSLVYTKQNRKKN